MSNNTFPISWHEEGLKNSKKCLDHLIKDRSDLDHAIQDLTIRIEAVEAQIARAKKEGKKAFNPDTYNRSRKLTEVNRGKS